MSPCQGDCRGFESLRSLHFFDLVSRRGSVAQLVEQLTLNQRVPGSSPGTSTSLFLNKVWLITTWVSSALLAVSWEGRHSGDRLTLPAAVRNDRPPKSGSNIPGDSYRDLSAPPPFPGRVAILATVLQRLRRSGMTALPNRDPTFQGIRMGIYLRPRRFLGGSPFLADRLTLPAAARNGRPPKSESNTPGDSYRVLSALSASSAVRFPAVSWEGRHSGDRLTLPAAVRNDRPPK